MMEPDPSTDRQKREGEGGTRFRWEHSYSNTYSASCYSNNKIKATYGTTFPSSLFNGSVKSLRPSKLSFYLYLLPHFICLLFQLFFLFFVEII